MRLFSRSLAEMRRYGNNEQRTTFVPMPTYRELRPYLSAEVRRCRRYERPLTIIVLAPQAVASNNGNGGSGAAHGETAHEANPNPWVTFSTELGCLLLGSILRGTLRETDIVTLAPENPDFLVLLPETDSESAIAAARRLGALFFERSTLMLRVGVASYPADGLTLDDLAAHARRTACVLPVIPPKRRLANGGRHE